MKTRAGLALGSNVGDRLENLRVARRAIFDLAGVSEPVLVSPIYETEPVDCEPGTAMFWNAALEVGFEASAVELLRNTKEIEIAHGRAAGHRQNAPRTIDIDLLYFGDETIDHDGLQVPHPRMFSRRFVLQPLFDLRPDLLLPGQAKSVRELLARAEGSARIVALPEEWS